MLYSSNNTHFNKNDYVFWSSTFLLLNPPKILPIYLHCKFTLIFSLIFFKGNEEWTKIFIWTLTSKALSSKNDYICRNLFFFQKLDLFQNNLEKWNFNRAKKTSVSCVPFFWSHFYNDWYGVFPKYLLTVMLADYQWWRQRKTWKTRDEKKGERC